MLAKQKAFKVIKAKLVVISVVAYSNFDKPFILTDTSGRGVEAVLHQKGNDEKEQIIAYASRIFNKYEKKYSITKDGVATKFY